jgi:iron complex transport system ATP-binding protein
VQRTASSASVIPALEARNVSVRYPSAPDGRDALAGVDLALRPGEMVVVIGPNGAGKSTLVRVLTGTLAPAAGSISLFGEPLAALRPRDVARRLAVVEQANEVAMGFRVADVVMMGRAPHQGPLQIPGAADRQIVAESLERAGIAHLASRPVEELSGGEQKLVAIARALAQRADVLVLDEASAHLDARHAIALYELALREVAERKVACLAVVHDLNVAAAFAHRVVLVRDGRIEADGPIEAVMTYGRLRDAFGVDLYVGFNELDDVRYFVPRRGDRR